MDRRLMKLHLNILTEKGDEQPLHGCSQVPARKKKHTFHVNKSEGRPTITLHSDPSLRFSFDSVSVKSLFENAAVPLIDSYLFKGKDSIILGLEAVASNGTSCIFNPSPLTQSIDSGLFSKTLNHIFQQTGPTSLNRRSWSSCVSHIAVLDSQSKEQQDGVQRNENTALTVSLFEVANNSIRDLLPSANSGSKTTSKSRSALSLITDPKDGKIKPYNISQYLIGSADDANRLISKALVSASLSSVKESHKFVFLNLLQRSESKADGKKAVTVTRMTFADLKNFAKDQSTVDVGRCLELVVTKQFNNSLLRTNKLTRLVFNDYVRSRIPLSVVVCIDQCSDESTILKTLKYTNPVEHHMLQRKRHDAAYYRVSDEMEKGRTVRSIAAKRRKPNKPTSVDARSISSSKRNSFDIPRDEPVSRVVSWSSGPYEENIKMVAHLKEGKTKLEMEVARLERDISALKGSKMQLEKQNQKVVKQLSEHHEREIDELKNRIAKVAIPDESEQLVELRKNIDEKTKEADTLKEDVMAKEEEISKVQSKIKELEGEIKDKDESIAKINEDLLSKDKTLSEMKKDIDTKADELDHVQKELETYKKEVEDLNKQLEGNNANSGATQGPVDKKSGDTEQLQQEIAEKSKKIEDLEQELKNSKSKIEEMREEAAKAQEKFDAEQPESEKEIQKLTEEKEAVDTQNSELSEKISSMEKEAEEAKKNYESKVLELKQSNSVIAEALKNTKISEEKYRSQINALEERFAMIKDKYTAFKSTNKKKQEEQGKKYKSLKKKFHALEAHYNAYKKNIEDEKKKQDEVYAQKKRELKKKMKEISNSGSTRSTETERSMSLSPQKAESLFDDENGEKRSPFTQSGSPCQSVRSSPTKSKGKRLNGESNGKAESLSLSAIPNLESIDGPGSNGEGVQTSIIPAGNIRNGKVSLEDAANETIPMEDVKDEAMPAEDGNSERKPLEAVTVSDLNTMSQAPQDGALKKKSASPSKKDKVKLRQVDLDDSGDITL